MLVKDCPEYNNAITKEELAEYLYAKIVNFVADVLRKQSGMHYDNALIDLGNQIACGESIYWDVYVQTVKDITFDYLKDIPEKFQWAMWQNSLYIDNIIDEDDVDVDSISHQEDIAEEVFQRLCPIAEREYDDNVFEDEFNE